MDTKATLAACYVKGEVKENYEDVPAEILDNLPNAANPEDYVYARWYTYTKYSNNQPFSLEVAFEETAYKVTVDENGVESAGEAIEGVFLGAENYDEYDPN